MNNAETEKEECSVCWTVEHNQTAYEHQYKLDRKRYNFEPGELQWKWRMNPPVTYDSQEVESAIIDALMQNGIDAWHGDAVGCVEQIVRAQYERWHKTREINVEQ